jgi:hypothetical protein
MFCHVQSLLRAIFGVPENQEVVGTVVHEQPSPSGGSSSNPPLAPLHQHTFPGPNPVVCAISTAITPPFEGGHMESFDPGGLILHEQSSPGSSSSSDPAPATSLGFGVHRYLTIQELAQLRQTSRTVRDVINQNGGGEEYIQSLLNTDITQLPPAILDGLILMGSTFNELPPVATLNGLSDSAFIILMGQQEHLRASNIIGLDDQHIILLTEQQLLSAFTNVGSATYTVPTGRPLVIRDVLSAIVPHPGIDRTPEQRQLLQSVVQVFTTFYRAHPPAEGYLMDYVFLHQINELEPGLINTELLDRVNSAIETNWLFSDTSSSGSGNSRDGETRRLSVINEELAGNKHTIAYLPANKLMQSQLETTQDHDWMSMVLLKGNTYSFRMNKLSGDLDTFLTLRDAKGNKVTHNDDSDGTLNSRITFTAEKSGVYFLDASSFASSSLGRYEISSNLDVATLGVNSQYTTALTSAKKSQLFKIELKAGQRYEFLMNRDPTASTFDAYLYLRDANKREITHDDDSGGLLNSKISYTAKSDGAYYLDASSYQERSVGKFTVVSHQVI